MARLTVIADDLTGALDTGVQFANRCVSVRVAAVHGTAAVHEELFQADVAVIDAEVRHRSPAASLQDLFRARATGAALRDGLRLYQNRFRAARQYRRDVPSSIGRQWRGGCVLCTGVAPDESLDTGRHPVHRWRTDQ